MTPTIELRSQFTAMGCPCEVRLFADHEDYGREILRLSVAEAQRFQHKYSRYEDGSIISQINDSAGRAPVAIDQETHAILQYSGVCYVQSNGLFDVTSGVLRRIWHKEMQALPTEAEIDECLAIIGWDKVQLDSDHVFLPLAGMELDFGGVVKEYAADAIAEQAKQAGIESGYINLGGDIALIGPQPDGHPWPIGIRDPNNPEQAAATLKLSSGAVSTSGGYERFFEIDGSRYSHLINPTTGWPVDSLKSVSVTAPKAVVAGSLTSIALLNGTEDGIDFLKSCEIPFLAIDLDDCSHGHLQELPHV